MAFKSALRTENHFCISVAGENEIRLLKLPLGVASISWPAFKKRKDVGETQKMCLGHQTYKALINISQTFRVNGVKNYFM